jgi:hypothetical protein
MDIRPGDLRCPRCLSLDVVASLSRGLLDRLMEKSGRIPRHCRVCGRRFYVKAALIGPPK